MKTTNRYYVLKNKTNDKFYATEYCGDEYRDLYNIIEVDKIDSANHFASLDAARKTLTYSKHEIIQVTEVTEVKRRYKTIKRD